MENSCKNHVKGDGSWWEHDGYNIPLCRVCEKCMDEKMAQYRSDIKERYEADEPIEED